MIPVAAKRFFFSFGILAGLMVVYCSAVAPFFEPTSEPVQRITTDSPRTKMRGWWSDLFAEGAWQNADPMLLQTRQGTLLYGSLQQPRPEMLRLSKLTLLLPMGKKDEPTAKPILHSFDTGAPTGAFAIIEAEEGEIEFDKAFEPTSGAAPPVVGGLFKGPLTITGFDFGKSRAPQWKLHTKNVQIERRRLWTIEPVDIEFGSSVARGRELSIYLKGDLLEPAPEGSGPWGLLDHMELLYVQEVRAQLPAGGLWKGMKLGDAARSAAIAAAPAELLFRCAGALKFDFNESLLTLSDRVHLTHALAGAGVDEFRCHGLRVRMEPAADVPGSTPATAGPEEVRLGSLIVKMIDAVGYNGVVPNQTETMVRVDAPNVGLDFEAKHMQAMLVEKRFLLSSRIKPEDQPGEVRVHYAGNTMRAPQIEYAAAKQKEHLGWLFAPGPGRLVTTDHPQHGKAEVSWHTSLQLQPTAAVQMITIAGKALIESTRQGHLAGEQIHIALQPIPVEQLPPNTPRAGDRFDQYQVDRVDANRDVAMGNGMQSLRVNDLHLQFVYVSRGLPANASTTMAPLSFNRIGSDSGSVRRASYTPGDPVAPPGLATTFGSAPTLGQVPSQQPAQSLTLPVPLEPLPSPPQPLSTPQNQPNPAPNMSLSDSAGRPMFQWVGPPSAPQGHAGAGNALPNPLGGAAPGASSMPLVILGKELRCKVIVDEKQSWIDGLVIEGPVAIKRDGIPSPDITDWRIEGGLLQLSGSPTGQYDVQITGAPARLAFGDGALIGPEIRLDQRTGHIWMDQPGEFTVPRELIARGRDGSSMDWRKPLKCRWNGRMMFDGTTARINGEILISGVVSQSPDRVCFIEGDCRQLDVQLTRSIDISKPKSGETALQSISLRDNVDIRMAQTDGQGNRQSLEQIVVPELRYELLNNQLVGIGPGWIRSHHYASRPGPLGSTVAATAPKLQAIHLKFGKRMDGFLNDSRLVFSGRVEVAGGPIPTWEHTIDLDQMQSLLPDQFLLRGDLLQAHSVGNAVGSPVQGSMISGGVMPGGAQAGSDWELQVQGNVGFEGKSESGNYSGSAYRITYAQAKNTLLVVSDGRIPATMKVSNSTGTNPDGAIQIEHALIDTQAMSIIEMNTYRVDIGPQGGVPAGPAAPGAAGLPAAPPSPRNSMQDLYRRK